MSEDIIDYTDILLEFTAVNEFHELHAPIIAALDDISARRSIVVFDTTTFCRPYHPSLETPVVNPHSWFIYNEAVRRGILVQFLSWADEEDSDAQRDVVTLLESLGVVDPQVTFCNKSVMPIEKTIGWRPELSEYNVLRYKDMQRRLRKKVKMLVSVSLSDILRTDVLPPVSKYIMFRNTDRVWSVKLSSNKKDYA